MKILKSSVKIVFTFFVFLSVCQPSACMSMGAGDFFKGAGINEKTNPHRNEKCFVCHKASNSLLIKENPTEGEVIQRKLMRVDLINLCINCHKASVQSRHMVGMPTKSNKENLPLDRDGNITCATTCHDVHTKDQRLVKKMLRQPFNVLCFSCHEI